MHVLLDHLAATLVGTAVLLVLLAVAYDSQHDGVQEALRDSHRELARTLATTLEDDIRNAGAGVPPSQSPLLTATEAKLSLRVKDGFGASPVRTITYRRLAGGLVPVGGVDVPLYAVERVVDGAVTQRYEGLSEFAFELRDAAGAATTDLASGRATHVRLTVGVPPAEADDIDARARYRRSVLMPNLAD